MTHLRAHAPQRIDAIIGKACARTANCNQQIGRSNNAISKRDFLLDILSAARSANNLLKQNTCLLRKRRHEIKRMCAVVG